MLRLPILEPFSLVSSPFRSLRRNISSELILDRNSPPKWCYLDTRKQAGVKVEIALRPELKLPRTKRENF